MKYFHLFIAAVAAVKLDKKEGPDAIEAYNVRWQKEAAGMHDGTMGEANRRLGNQQAGVAESAAEQKAYNVAHGCHNN